MNALRRRWLEAVPLLVLCAASGLGQQGQPAFPPEWKAPPFRATSGLDVVAVPLEIFGNQPYVQVLVKGKPYWFILDSGASTSVIDTALSTSIGFKVKYTAQGRGAGAGTVPFHYLEGASYRLPGLEGEIPLAIAIDLSNNLAQVGRELPGIIGHNFFERYVVEVNYDAKVMRIFDAVKYRYVGRGESLPIVIEKRVPHVVARLTVPGLPPQDRKLLVDTGSNDSVDDSLLAQSTGPKRQVVGGVGLGQEYKVTFARFDKVQLGRYVLENVPGVGDGVALIGGEVLRRFTVIFDYGRQRMILEPNRHLRDSFSDLFTGLDLRLEPDSRLFRAHSVDKGSPAEQAGLKEGDLITSIDGIPARDYTLPQALAMLERPGAQYLLEIRRGKESLRVSIRLPVD